MKTPQEIERSRIPTLTFRRRHRSTKILYQDHVYTTGTDIQCLSELMSDMAWDVCQESPCYILAEALHETIGEFVDDGTPKIYDALYNLLTEFIKIHDDDGRLIKPVRDNADSPQNPLEAMDDPAHPRCICGLDLPFKCPVHQKEQRSADSPQNPR